MKTILHPIKAIRACIRWPGVKRAQARKAKIVWLKRERLSLLEASQRIAEEIKRLEKR
ncbi:hypothetical protein LCGC14_0868190 [marine sediment metagenome]|uniref:Uncharacterized protein n=1 Tax=marine sediment metagenome TaxID=412755 RepID=A0A0F9K0V5_9ZZZZ